ncbi:MAG: hypothetical protein ABFS19_10080 [Thermodesulfobacteriota bacterium]
MSKLRHGRKWVINCYCRGLLMLIVFVGLVLAYPASVMALQSRYGELVYERRELLLEFNRKLRLSKNMKRVIKTKKIVSVEDEVTAKTNLIIDRVQVILNMFPADDMQLKIMLLPNKKGVAAFYRKQYGKDVDYCAYYSFSLKTVYISVRDTRLQLLAHEIGHAVVDHYFDARPPHAIHEMMAVFTEQHIGD